MLDGEHNGILLYDNSNIIFLFKVITLSTIFSFSSFHGLVVWGWGLRIDSVLTLSRPCTADAILIKINNIQ